VRPSRLIVVADAGIRRLGKSALVGDCRTPGDIRPTDDLDAWSGLPSDFLITFT
jgi:hypothetical protein